MKWMLLVFFLFSCNKKSEIVNIETVEIDTIAQEIQIPKNIMTDLINEIVQESKTVAPVFLFIPLQVRFHELSEDVLKKSDIIYNLPKGGGRIDLSELVIGEGSFFMSFPPEQFETLSEFKPELIHLYYISNSPAKKIDDESFGLGCGKMLDLKKSFESLQKPDFLKLNSTGLRYLHVTAGNYIFIFKQSTKIYITQLTLTDTRYPNNLCLGTEN